MTRFGLNAEQAEKNLQRAREERARFPANPLKIKRLHQDAIFPRYAKPGDAALTLYSKETFVISPGQIRKIPLGYAVWLQNEEWAGVVVPRSGKGTEGLVLANLTGIIDSNYQGELILQCWNRGLNFIHISSGDGIAQMMITRRVTVELLEVENFEEVTSRGEGGFGSTDVTGTLRNWKIVDNHAYGEVYGHPYYPDGYCIRTSRIVKTEADCIYTENSIYRVGE